MQTFIIRRREAWKDPQELEAVAARSKQIGDEEMSDDVRWIRTYVVDDGDTLGSLCVYQATSPEALRSTRNASACPPTRSRWWPTRSWSAPTRAGPSLQLSADFSSWWKEKSRRSRARTVYPGSRARTWYTEMKPRSKPRRAARR